jgi:hypothetical protein
MTLLICPVRPGDVNEELRFALRSWERNLILPDGMELLTVGYKPSWLDPDNHVKGNKFKSMPHAVFDNIRLASEWAVDAGLGEEDAIYMNDDFFCLDPVGCVLPVKRNLTLAQHLASVGPSSATWWPRSLRLTASWLDSEGFPDPDSFEVHRPLLASPGGMFEALSRWDLGSGDTVPQWRTVYGTLSKVKAYPVMDGKLGTRTTGYGTPWVSTSDQSWRRYAPTIKPRFQKPSRWEKR